MTFREPSRQGAGFKKGNKKKKLDAQKWRLNIDPTYF